MKTIILNGSPRKNWNTAMMLKEAQKGAAAAGAETEYIDLFDPLFPMTFFPVDFVGQYRPE